MKALNTLISLLRTAVWFLGMGLSLLLMSPLALYYKWKLDPKPGPAIDPTVEKIVQRWALCMLAVAGITVRVEGEEHIPREAALFVGNHQGNFDIPIILSKLGPLKSILAKKETGKIPGVHLWMTHFHCILMDRDDPRQSLRSLQEVRKLLELGRSVILFPEGTRSKSGSMAEFKPGALRSALKAGVPIVPFVLDGSWRAMEEHGGLMRPARVALSILPALPASQIQGQSTGQVSMQVQQLIQDQLDSWHRTPEEDKIQWMSPQETAPNPVR